MRFDAGPQVICVKRHSLGSDPAWMQLREVPKAQPVAHDGASPSSHVIQLWTCRRCAVTLELIDDVDLENVISSVMALLST